MIICFSGIYEEPELLLGKVKGIKLDVNMSSLCVAQKSLEGRNAQNENQMERSNFSFKSVYRFCSGWTQRIGIVLGRI